jgi:shikimate kinase
MIVTVFLTGFMGTGKTVVGRTLATRMGYGFVDTDDLIEKKAGRTIRQIFVERGEEVFRRMEIEAIQEAARMEKGVIALGGGAVTREENWATIRKSGGVCVCLMATPETILDRVKDAEERPLLAGLSRKGRLTKIRQMLEERDKFYTRADIRVVTDERSVEELVGEIIEKLQPTLEAIRKMVCTLSVSEQGPPSAKTAPTRL